MKKNIISEVATYTQATEKDEVKTLVEHVETETVITVLLDENKLDENSFNAKINKAEFQSLFGPKAKPRKGDFLSLSTGKFKVKGKEKYKAKKTGNKGYKLSLKKVV
jgi:hypothetical protein